MKAVLNFCGFSSGNGVFFIREKAQMDVLLVDLNLRQPFLISLFPVHTDHAGSVISAFRYVPAVCCAAYLSKIIALIV